MINDYSIETCIETIHPYVKKKGYGFLLEDHFLVIIQVEKEYFIITKTKGWFLNHLGDNIWAEEYQQFQKRQLEGF